MKVWEKLKAAVKWCRAKEERLAGICLAVFFAAIIVDSCMEDRPRTTEHEKKEKAVTEKENTSIRQDMSDLWHWTKCKVRLCDEDGRCPVWSSKYSKCYMLDKEGEKNLKEAQGRCTKEQYETDGAWCNF